MLTKQSLQQVTRSIKILGVVGVSTLISACGGIGSPPGAIYMFMGYGQVPTISLPSRSVPGAYFGFEWDGAFSLNRVARQDIYLDGERWSGYANILVQNQTPGQPTALMFLIERPCQVMPNGREVEFRVKLSDAEGSTLYEKTGHYHLTCR